MHNGWLAFGSIMKRLGVWDFISAMPLSFLDTQYEVHWTLFFLFHLALGGNFGDKMTWRLTNTVVRALQSLGTKFIYILPLFISALAFDLAKNMVGLLFILRWTRPSEFATVARSIAQQRGINNPYCLPSVMIKNPERWRKVAKQAIMFVIFHFFPLPIHTLKKHSPEMDAVSLFARPEDPVEYFSEKYCGWCCKFQFHSNVNSRWGRLPPGSFRPTSPFLITAWTRKNASGSFLGRWWWWWW